MKKRRIISGKEIGSVIKKRRRELGISQQSLADEIGVTYQQIQRYESGSNKLNVDNLQAIAGILQMPVTQFFEGLEPVLSIPVSPDELILLKIYRSIGIKDKISKQFVIKAAKFAAKK